MARILVVDDDGTILRILQNFLTASGYEVVPASCGSQALQLCATECPDLILLDIVLPGMDGFETCRRFKANNTTAHVPVILMTCSPGVSLNKQAFAAGAAFTLPKVFSAERLVNLVNLALAPARSGAVKA